MRLVDVGRVVEVVEVRNKGKVFYVVIVDGVNSAWKVYSGRVVMLGEKVVVIERNGRVFLRLIDELFEGR